MAWIKIGKYKAYSDDQINKLVYEAMEKDYKSRLKDADLLSLKEINTGQAGPFPRWDPSHPERYSRPITVFDTETGANNEIIALGAVKVVYNNLTRQFETVDTYERYYQPSVTKGKQWFEALSIHGLTPTIIHKLRKQQSRRGIPSYGKHYDAQEQIAFRNFFEGSVLAGHNINNADIPWALGDYLPKSAGTMDTLIALENMRGRGGNKLDEVFKDVTGKTMEQAGFGHHNAMSDTYATSVVLNALLNQKNATGASLRYVLKHPGTHIAPTDTPDVFGESQISVGPYKGYLRSPEYYISKRNMKMDDRYDIFDPETKALKDGYHIDTPQDVSAEDAIQDAVLRSLEAGIPRSVDTSKVNTQFVALAQGIKDAQVQLAQSLKDMSGALRVNTASSRPATLRFLSKFASRDTDFVNNQRWMDAADALHIPTTEWSKYYKSSLDYAQVMGTESSKGIINRVEKAYTQNRITKAQRTKILNSDFDNMDISLTKSIEYTKRRREKEAEKEANTYESLREFASRLSRESTDNDITPERLRSAKRAERYLKHGRITKGQYDKIVSSYDNMDDALEEAAAKTEMFTNALKKLSTVPIFDPERIVNAQIGGMSQTLGAARGIFPSFMMNPASRTVDIIAAMKRYNYAPFKAAGNIANAAGASAPFIGSTIGGVVGGLPGAAIGGAIGGGVNLVTQVVGNTMEAQTTRKWYQASSNMNMLGLGFDIITMPIKMLQQATKLLTKDFLRLGSLLKGFTFNNLGQMSQLGNPLTTLTGIGYSDFQGLERAEVMLGLGRGSLNSMSEDFSKQMQLLYSTGQMNQRRVVASSMLGVFSDVYGPQGSLESTINNLMKKDLSPRDMALASEINSSLPQILQVMKDIGATTLSQLKNPSALRGMYFNPIRGPGEGGRRIWDSTTGAYVSERTAFRQDAYEFGAFKGSMSNTGMRIADRLWRSGGKDIANNISGILDTFASGGSFKEMWDSLRNLKVGGFSINDIWGKIQSGLDSLWSGNLLPKLAGLIQSLGDIYLSGIDRLINTLAPLINTGLNALMNLKLTGNPVTGFSVEMQKGGIRERSVDVVWAKGWEHQYRDASKPYTAEDYLEEFRAGRLDAIVYRDVNGNKQLFDARGKTPEEREQMYRNFKGSLAFKNYVDYTGGIKATAHEATGLARTALVETLANAPEVIEAIAGSVKRMTQEVITTVRLELVDASGKVKIVTGVGNSATADGIKATVQSIQSRRN